MIRSGNVPEGVIGDKPIELVRLYVSPRKPWQRRWRGFDAGLY